MEYIEFNNTLFKKTSWEGYYISQDGLVCTVKVRGGQGLLDYNNPRLHSRKEDRDGYYEYCFSCGGNGRKVFYRRAHRVVYETWVHKIPPGKVVDHINRNKKDNRLENLRVCSIKENNHNRGYSYEQMGEDKRKYYRLHLGEELKGVFWAKEMSQFGITYRDINLYNNGVMTKRAQRLKMKIEEV